MTRMSDQTKEVCNSNDSIYDLLFQSHDIQRSTQYRVKVMQVCRISRTVFLKYHVSPWLIMTHLAKTSAKYRRFKRNIGDISISQTKTHIVAGTRWLSFKTKEKQAKRSKRNLLTYLFNCLSLSSCFLNIFPTFFLAHGEGHFDSM